VNVVDVVDVNVADVLFNLVVCLFSFGNGGGSL
jgi:hypothetical protein